MRHRLFPLGLFFGLIFASQAWADHQVTVTALPAVPGMRCGASINDLGDVLVNCSSNTFPAPPAVAYVWSNGVRTNISGPADISGCVAINNAKQVACNTNSSTPFLWQNGTVTSLSGMRSVSALNDLGEVFGGISVGSANGLRRANGTIVTAPTSLFFWGGPLNNLSQVPTRPAATALYDTIGTWSPNAGYVVADKGWDFLSGINDAGQMTSVLNQRTMLFTPGRGWQSLPPPPGYPTGFATAAQSAVNSAGQVAGSFVAEDPGQSSGQSHGVYWITRAYPIDLGAYQSLPTTASDSNPSGQVVGSATISASESIPLLWTVTNVPSPLPQPSPGDTTFRWLPSDGSTASGRMTISAPASGPFSVAANRVTSLQFTFAPGVAIQLLEGVEQTGHPVMSFDGTGLDSGTIRLRRGAYAADVILELQPDALGVDEASFDPLGEVNQQVIRRGRWVRENATPPVVPLPPGVLSVIDATQALADEPFGLNTGVAYDSVRNVLYVTRGANNPFVYTVTTSGNVVRKLDFSSAYQPNYIPFSLTYDPTTDHLYVFTSDNGTTTSRRGTRVVEMTTDGLQIIRSIAIPSTDGMVRADGIWLVAGKALQRYSFAGTLQEEVSLSGSLPDGNLTSVASPFNSPDGFVLVDETLNRLVTASRQGIRQGETTTNMLDADHLGGARAAAMELLGGPMFLLTRNGTIFVLHPSFTNTHSVSSLLQLTSSSVTSSPSPSPSGAAGSFTISARFNNPSAATVCNVFFKVTELTVDGRRGVDQLETVTVPSTGHQVQGFGEQVLGHAPVDLAPNAAQDFNFRVDLGSRKAFNFLVDAWGTPAPSGTSCR